MRSQHIKCICTLAVTTVTHYTQVQVFAKSVSTFHATFLSPLHSSPGPSFTNTWPAEFSGWNAVRCLNDLIWGQSSFHRLCIFHATSLPPFFVFSEPFICQYMARQFFWVRCHALPKWLDVTSVVFPLPWVVFPTLQKYVAIETLALVFPFSDT